MFYKTCVLIIVDIPDDVINKICDLYNNNKYICETISRVVFYGFFNTSKYINTNRDLFVAYYNNLHKFLRVINYKEFLILNCKYFNLK